VLTNRKWRDQDLETLAARKWKWTKRLKTGAKTQNRFVFVQRILLFSNEVFSTPTWFRKKLLLEINPRAAGRSIIGAGSPLQHAKG